MHRRSSTRSECDCFLPLVTVFTFVLGDYDGTAPSRLFVPIWRLRLQFHRVCTMTMTFLYLLCSCLSCSNFPNATTALNAAFRTAGQLVSCEAGHVHSTPGRVAVVTNGENKEPEMLWQETDKAGSAVRATAAEMSTFVLCRSLAKWRGSRVYRTFDKRKLKGRATRWHEKDSSWSATERRWGGREQQ